jgi:hypothetical protein
MRGKVSRLIICQEMLMKEWVSRVPMIRWAPLVHLCEKIDIAAKWLNEGKDIDSISRCASDNAKVDRRLLPEENLRELIITNCNLEAEQREDLFTVLLKYRQHFTSKPARCKVFEYKFQMVDLKPAVGHSQRFQPEQISDTRMLRDEIETSDSPFINPLTIVYKENKQPPVCLDVRKINSIMVPDRARALPLEETFQLFHGARHITSLDLSPAFLQIPLAKESRKYTAFLFECQVFHYQVVPFGFRDSLASFASALQTVLGHEVSQFCMAFVDDIIVHSSSFEDHLHLDKILKKLSCRVYRECTEMQVLPTRNDLSRTF